MFRIGFLYSVLSLCISIHGETGNGFLEGRLKIISIKEVELAHTGPAKPDAGNYGDYPLVVLNKTTRRQVAHVIADRHGDYRLELPPGDYILDVDRRLGGNPRTTPQLFTVSPQQTVRVNMQVDTGIR